MQRILNLARHLMISMAGLLEVKLLKEGTKVGVVDFGVRFMKAKEKENKL
jgi:hypothetical protein